MKEILRVLYDKSKSKSLGNIKKVNNNIFNWCVVEGLFLRVLILFTRDCAN